MKKTDTLSQRTLENVAKRKVISRSLRESRSKLKAVVSLELKKATG